MTFCAFTAKPLNTRGSGNKSNHKLDTLQLQRTGVHLQTDDSHTETCKIFPKEVFSFLPDSGFKGYDDTVWIKLRIRKQSQSRDSSQINSNVNFTLQRVTVEKQAQNNWELNEQKSRERFGSKSVGAWSVILLFFVVMGIYLKFRG